jgi:hypothetical protein
MSLICFQYLRLGTEEVAGRAPIVASGRQRGYDVIEQIGLLGQASDPSIIKEKLGQALGEQGTRLCLLRSIVAHADGSYEVQITEGACTAGQTASEPVCAFTLGVFVGAISALTGQRMIGRETACCACGADACVYCIEPIG